MKESQSFFLKTGFGLKRIVAVNPKDWIVLTKENGVERSFYATPDSEVVRR